MNVKNLDQFKSMTLNMTVDELCDFFFDSIVLTSTIPPAKAELGRGAFKQKMVDRLYRKFLCDREKQKIGGHFKSLLTGAALPDNHIAVVGRQQAEVFSENLVEIK